jgi:hypothetical protein
MGQARVIIWDLLMNLGRDVIDSAHVNNLEIKLINGITIYIRGADRPDTLRGVSLTFVVLDEYADMKPVVWEQIIRAALSDQKGDALFIGTPKGRNHFYDLFLIGDEESDSYDSEYKSWQLTTADNELIDPKEIEAARRTLSSFAFNQEYMASFNNAGTDLFKEGWLKYGNEPREGSYYMACDLAGFEDVAVANTVRKKRLDQSAFAIVKVTDDGKWFVRKIEFGRWDVRETAVRILKNYREFKPLMVGIEKGTTFNAVMPYLTDLMRKNGVYFHIHPLTHQNQKKTDRIVWALQGMFEHGRITLNSEGMKERNGWQEVFRDEYLMFPTPNVHDDCFPADTSIITLDKVKRIEDVTTDDYVLTRNGYRKVLKAWCKGNKKVITKYGITGTPEHRVWTENRSWVSLDSLCDTDILLVSQPVEVTSCEKQSNSMEEAITDTQKQSKAITGNTTQAMMLGEKHQDCSIETSGNFTTGQFQKDTTFTILTETSTTTQLKTLFASHQPRIMWSIVRKVAKEVNRQNKWLISLPFGLLLTNGTRRKNVEHGAESMRKKRYSEIGLKNDAMNAAALSSQKYLGKSCAVESVETTGKQGLLENAVPVYDLMVEGDHEFFADGVLVHNCIESLAYINQMAVTNYGSADVDDDMYAPIDLISGI